MDQLQTNVFTKLGVLVLVVPRLSRCVALLCNVALSNEPCRRPVVGRIHLVFGQHALSYEQLRPGATAEHTDRYICVAQIGDRVNVRIHLRIPHDHLRVLIQRGYNLDYRSVVPEERNRIRIRISQRDVHVGVHLSHGVLEPDRWATSPNLDINPGINPGCHQRTGRCLVVTIDHVVVTDHFVHSAMLRLGEPIGLDHNGGRTNTSQPSCGDSCCRCRSSRCRWCRCRGRSRGCCHCLLNARRRGVVVGTTGPSY